MLSFMGVLYQMLVEIGWYSNNWVLFSKSSTPVMPQKRKDYVRFAVGQYAKEKKIRQQELAKEKASLSSEVKTLQRQIQRLDNKVFKFRYGGLFLTQIDINL